MQKCLSVRIANISYTKLWLYSNTVHYLVFLSSFFPWNSVSLWLWGLGSPTLTVSVVVSLLRCLKMIRPFLNKLTFICYMAVTVKLHDFVESISQRMGILLSGKILCEEIQSKVHWGLKGLKEMARNSLFKLAAKLSMTLVCYRNSTCLSNLSFLFQQLANMGGIWKRGWKKKGSAPSGIPYW